MIIHKAIRTQVIRIGTLRTDFQLSDKITLENLNILSQGSHIMTGYQYLTPVYLIEKPDGIQISGILESNVIWVTYPEQAGHYIEDYLSALLSIIPDQQFSGTIFHTIFRDMKNSVTILLRRKKQSEPENNQVKELFID